jgi:hypothetical protein
VTRSDNKLACIEEEVPEVSTSASYQEQQCISKAVAFSKEPAKAEPIENTTPKMAMAPIVPQKHATSLEAQNYKILRNSQRNYSI